MYVAAVYIQIVYMYPFHFFVSLKIILIRVLPFLPEILDPYNSIIIILLIIIMAYLELLQNNKIRNTVYLRRRYEGGGGGGG